MYGCELWDLNRNYVRDFKVAYSNFCYLSIYLMFFCESTGPNDVMVSNLLFMVMSHIAICYSLLFLSIPYSKRVVCQIAICYLLYLAFHGAVNTKTREPKLP